MRKTLYFFAIIALVCFGCRNKNEPEKTETPAADTSHFFQTALLIQKDFREIDSTPFFMYKITNVNGRQDSIAIKKEEFKQLAQQFLKPDITTTELKPFYKENIFEDRTTNGFTVNYSAKNKELEVQSIDILLKDDGNTVKNILIRKFYRYTDSTAIEQLNWKPGQRFQVVRSVQKSDNTENNYQTLVVWNGKS